MTHKVKNFASYSQHLSSKPQNNDFEATEKTLLQHKSGQAGKPLKSTYTCGK